MKSQKILVSVISCCALVFLCSCASIGDKFSIPSADMLILGVMTPDQAVALFGEPLSTGEKMNSDGSYVVYEYAFTAANFSAVSKRIMLLEFKNGALNGYLYGSTFDADKTKINLQDVDALKSGFGKLTRVDVMNLMGEPDGKAICPSVINEFKERCDKNTEVWGWEMADNISLWVSNPQKIKISELYVTFDKSGKVSDVELLDVSQPFIGAHGVIF